MGEQLHLLNISIDYHDSPSTSASSSMAEDEQAVVRSRKRPLMTESETIGIIALSELNRLSNWKRTSLNGSKSELLNFGAENGTPCVEEQLLFNLAESPEKQRPSPPRAKRRRLQAPTTIVKQELARAAFGTGSVVFFTLPYNDLYKLGRVVSVLGNDQYQIVEIDLESEQELSDPYVVPKSDMLMTTKTDGLSWAGKYVPEVIKGDTAHSVFCPVPGCEMWQRLPGNLWTHFVAKHRGLQVKCTLCPHQCSPSAFPHHFKHVHNTIVDGRGKSVVQYGKWVFRKSVAAKQAKLEQMFPKRRSDGSLTPASSSCTHTNTPLQTTR